MCAPKQRGTIVLIETNYGNIKVELYENTPLHRDNFVKLVNDGAFDGKIFHRVIKDFMIQAGEPNSKSPSDSTAVINKGDTISAEFRLPQYFHKRGALAAARWDDWENPTKASTANQFYIVTGKKIYDFDLKEIEKQRYERLKQSILSQLQADGKDTLKAMYKSGNKAAMAEFRNSMIAKSEEIADSRKAETLFDDWQKEIYKEIGGAPHLDGEYTVFGEVVEGMDVVEKIENTKVNSKDRPLETVRIIRTKIIGK